MKFKVGDKVIVREWTYNGRQIKGVVSDSYKNFLGQMMVHIKGSVKDCWWDENDLLLIKE